MSEWKIAGQADACSVCGKTFEPGEAFASAIFTGGDGEFLRKDACPGCFEKIEETPYSRWLTRRPDAAKKAPLLDLALAKDFLVRLARENDPGRRGLMYILSLLLLRKRKVKLCEQRTEEDGTSVMRYTVKSEEGETDLAIPVCELSEEERDEIEAELGRLFGLA